jgi:hypothetical protein
MSTTASPPFAHGMGTWTWPGIFIAPLAFFANLTVLYVLVPWVCGNQQHWLLHAFAAAMLVLGLVGVAAGWATWREGWDVPGADDADHVTRSQFLGIVGTLMSAIFVLGIATQWFTQFIISPCLS